ncbi:Pvc16 family protein [Bradyrhizobium sp. USDA 3315]
MQGDAIQRVGVEIAKRIEGASGVTVYHGPPDASDDDKQGPKSLVLFPLRAMVNAELRNVEHRAPPKNANGPDVIYDESLPLDVHYLLCPNPAVRPGPDWDGVQLLGKALQALNGPAGRFGLLVQGELVHLSLDFVSSEEMGRIWALFPAINYRTSVVYLATPVWIDPATERVTGTPVVHEKYLPRPVPVVERG